LVEVIFSNIENEYISDNKSPGQRWQEG